MSSYAEVSDPMQEASGWWWLLLLLGAMCIAAGVIVLVQPDISLATLAVVAGIFLLIDGIYDVVVAIAERVEGRGLLAVIGVLSAIAGIILIRHPVQSVVAIALTPRLASRRTGCRASGCTSGSLGGDDSGCRAVTLV